MGNNFFLVPREEFIETKKKLLKKYDLYFLKINVT
jgi:hypothetical protein